MAITRIELENFTVFERLVLEPSPGINVLIGTNGTGKTHLLKAAYALCTGNRSPRGFIRLLDIFRPYGGEIRRLIRHRASHAELQVTFTGGKARCRLDPKPITVDEDEAPFWGERSPLERNAFLYLPTKDILANAPGFRSLYAAREIEFELMYADLLDATFLPTLKKLPDDFENVREILRREIGGRIEYRGETFFVRDGRRLVDFSMIAEGHRKLALLWLLIGNGTIAPGSVVFWDEPEANLNPLLVRTIAEASLALQRVGVQFFLATHDFGLLRELDLAANSKDAMRVHLLYRDRPRAPVTIASGDRLEDLPDDPLTMAQTARYERAVGRAIGRTAAE